jgi:excisionase family DNA binding protein
MSSFQPEPLALTPEDVARKLQIGRTRVYHYLSTGELDSILIGRHRRILPHQLDEFIEYLREQAAGLDETEEPEDEELELEESELEEPSPRRLQEAERAKKPGRTREVSARR